MKKASPLLFIAFMSGQLMAQKFVAPKESIPSSAFDKKWRWGITYTQSWSTIKGTDLPAPYFSKASVGLQVSAEYFPLKFLGLSAGAGYQQRGTGIRNANAGPVDSTYRDRLRFNTFEFPIAVIIRTPKDIIKGLRFSGSLGIVPVINRNSRDVKISLEPNIADLDKTTDVSAKYFKSDVALQFTGGPEIDMAANLVIKIQFYYSRGTADVFAAGQGTGHNQNTGIRICLMF